MLALFSIVVNSENVPEIHEGTLFSIPAELKDNYRIKTYLSINTQGWSTSEHGYQIFIKTDGFGNRYILPGLYLTDAPRPQKKIHGYKPLLSRNQVEKYITQHLSRNTSLRSKADAELTALVHDLRHLSSSIYHSAIEANIANNKKQIRVVRESLKTVVATQTMLKVRIDYLDFV